MGWIGKERVQVESEAKPPRASNTASSSDVGAPLPRAPTTPGNNGPERIVPKELHGRLSKNCPYIGFFHHAPSAGNRSRQTYFEKDIISNEVIRKQHEVRSNPMIGNFHYGHDLYGKKMEQFQRILSQLRAKDEEREVQALLDRQVWHFGGASLVGPFQSSQGDLSPQSGAAVTARYYRGRACSIPDSTAASLKLSARSHSVTEAPLTPPCCVAPIEGASTESFGISVVASEGRKGKLRRISCGSEGGSKAFRSLANGVHALEEEEDSDVQSGFGGGAGATPRKQLDVADYLEREERRKLRARAFATVVYASGDSLVKLAEKERRKCASTKRFKYTGAIDVSKAYPKTGSLDDCALLRSEVAERSRLYNDLISEVNGFRRHFFLRQKLHPKEAYLHARRQRQQEAESSMNQNQVNGDVYSDDDAESCISWSRQKSDVSVTLVSNGDISGGNNGGLGVEAGIGAYYADHGWSGARGVVSDDGVPPFHTLVGPGQFARHDRHTDQAKPGDAWMPGTVSALRTKESWRSKQAMRDFRKFKPFFVQAKTDFTATYRLLEDSVLGEGSYATVYLAEHLERGDVVAVKAVQKRLLFSEMEKKSVGREIDNQLRIVHKHVVRLYEVYETPENVYIVLEHCDCGDLEKMMYVRGRLTEIEAKRVTKQLLEALRYLHGKGIVHCDLKPHNLLFAPDPAYPDEPTPSENGTSRGLNGRGKQQLGPTSPAGKLAKLCDFGLSCKVPDVRFYKQTGDINKIPWSGLFGTGGYISPEVMNQQPFGKPADLWGVGVMLYQMISGRLPFIPARVCTSKPVSFPAAVWADVNAGVKDLICGLLEKDPAQRLTAAQALQHPWIQTIQHLRPSFPHFVPKQCRCSSMDSSRSSGSSS